MEAPNKIDTATITWQVPLQANGVLTLPHDVLDAIGDVHAFTFVRHRDGTRALRPVRSGLREQRAEQIVLEPNDTIMLPFPYAYGIDEGTPFALTLRPDGDITLQIIEEHDPDQAWFWTEEWQRGERDVDEDIAAGRVKTFDDVERFIAYLEGDREE